MLGVEEAVVRYEPPSFKNGHRTEQHCRDEGFDVCRTSREQYRGECGMENVVKNNAVLPVVVQRSELLSNFASYLNETYNLNVYIDEQDVEEFTKIAL